MIGWNEGFVDAGEYIEQHLLEAMDINEIAQRAYVSALHFQRIFHVLCGITVGEYSRNRRLTLAAEEITATGVKVITVAVRDGYDSPDIFTRSFTKFHGVSPSQAKKIGVTLISFAPLRFTLTL